MTTLVFIINYQRLTLPKRMADYLADCHDIKPIIVDNHSDYPPLLSYYETCPHEVLRMNRNYGCSVVHNKQWGVLDHYNQTGHFVITDPDLEIDHIPKDWLHELETGLAADQPRASTCGFGLRIDDLPPGVNHKQGMEWTRPIMNGRFYKSAIDTTFALWRAKKRDGFAAVRTNHPYLARHAPWYYQTVEDLPPDELYYLKSITPGVWNNFSGELKGKLNL